MCGICGIFLKDSSSVSMTSHRDAVLKMIHMLHHRGPDNTGVYSDGPVSLGTSRLAIIDLSADANQPMTIEKGNYAITFNGEIYNYIELREELKKKGVVFKTSSDTEVILHLYKQLGMNFLEKLRGMFAFAIWDKAKSTLIIARDRVGEKPLVYSEYNNCFVFASEIKALLSINFIPRQINPTGLHYGLHYVNIPAPYSAFKHIYKLEPGQYMVITEKDKTIHTYWQPQNSTYSMITDYNEAIFEINKCLDQTVKIMSRSDVPIGVTLSGGLDSSAVVASLCKEIHPVTTFCVSYQIKGHDSEFQEARRVAQQYNTIHNELEFSFGHLTGIKDIIKSFDEPVATFVPLHAHSLASMISGHVKVALTGNGGDELFGGYRDHLNFFNLEKKLNLWKWLNKSGVGKIINSLPLSFLKRSKAKYDRISHIPVNRIAAFFRLAHAEKFCSQVYSDHAAKAMGDIDTADLLISQFNNGNADSILNGFFFQQLMVGSQHSIVDIPDICGMANSLEYRSPFLDVKMIELALRIPWNMKIKARLKSAGGKWIFREAMKNRLPKDIVSMKKAGFGSSIPYRSFMLKDWSEFVLKSLESQALKDSGLFDVSKVKTLYLMAQKDYSIPIEMLWGIVMISQWLEEYF